MCVFIYTFSNYTLKMNDSEIDTDLIWKQFDKIQERNNDKKNNLNSEIYKNNPSNKITGDITNSNINNVDSYKLTSSNSNTGINKIKYCRNCENTNLVHENLKVICSDCGLVLCNDADIDFCNYSNLSEVNKINSSDNTILPSVNDNDNNKINFSIKCNSKKSQFSNKIQKLQKWNMWSNDEKTSYKLSLHTKYICDKLDINPGLINAICNTVNEVMNIIKKFDGTKRSRVKDGIIIVCIHYVLKANSTVVTTAQLSKTLNLDIKYVTRAERLILELVNSNKLKLDKNVMFVNNTPFDYVTDIINRYNINIPENLLNETEKLIETCKHLDILLDHTPLSIGVSCLYYVLTTYQVDMNFKMFCDLYNLSCVTVLKTYNKLKNKLNLLDIKQ